MTKRQEEIIKDNLRAYKANFDFIKIEDADYGVDFMFLPVKKGQKTEIGRSIATTLIT